MPPELVALVGADEIRAFHARVLAELEAIRHRRRGGKVLAELHARGDGRVVDALVGRMERT